MYCSCEERYSRERIRDSCRMHWESETKLDLDDRVIANQKQPRSRLKLKLILNFCERLVCKVNTLKIPILYALIGWLGIWFSDKLFFTLVLDADQEIIVNIHIVRGFLLILSSVCIICFLIHRSEKTLRESEAKFRSLFEHNPDAVYSFDQEGNLLAVNPIAEIITGYHSEELLEQSFRLLVSKESVNRTMECFGESLQGRPQIYEITMLHKHGHQVECYAKNVPIIVKDKIVGVHVIVKDLTEQKRTQELLQKSDRLAVVGKLAAGIAHEIRNPLTAVKGFIQLLCRRIDGFQEYFSIMLRELDRIEVIVGEFLIIAKPQVKQIRLKDPLILLEDVIKLLDSQAIMNNVQFSLEAGLDIPLITCEENHLKQVFINLLENAIESMPSGGRIEIKVEKKYEKSILIRIIDQGCGIPKERIPKLGEPFYTTKEKGTGLGLMVSYKIIEAHQGQINIMSEMGEGAIVEIILPVEFEKSNSNSVSPVEMLLVNEFRH